ncbi:MAG: hypothetical protein EOP10_04970 [Proteobacteria bacterium]|nr:MAG: hypothetical protein EOP10_04970 [Pseudomonadota bacterium]
MLKKFIAIADTFIPPIVKNREEQFKARLILYPNLCAAIIVFSILMTMIASGSFRYSQALSYFSLMILHVSFLFVLKKCTSIEWTGIAFLCVLSLKTAIETVYIAGSPINSGMHNFPLYLVFGFFITSRWQKRVVLAAWLLFLTVATMQLIRIQGFTLPYNQDIQTVVKNASIAIGLRSLLALVSVYWFVQIRNIADQDLDREIEWQIRSEKLDEITNMIKSMFPRLDVPLDRIGETLRTLKSTDVSPRIRELEADVIQLKEVAQSISWAYRAFRNEHIAETSSEIILEQLYVMLERSHFDSGWTIRVKSPDQPINLRGPVPSLMLLILSLVDQIIAGSSTIAERSVEIEFKTVEGEQIWFLSWPPSDFTSKDMTKKILIEELGSNIKAKISDLTNPLRNLIEIRGKWQSPLTIKGH